MIIKGELLLTVNGLNNPIKPRFRDDIHANGYWHRTTHIWVINDKQQVLCQKRSLLKDTNPGKWESFFGGHLTPGQDYLEGAIKELKEELGIDLQKDNFHFFQIYKCISDKEFQGIYYIEWNGVIDNLILEKEEIDQVKWFNISELIEVLIERKRKNWTLWGYQEELLQKLAAHSCS